MTAETATDFVARLNQLRAWAGRPSYRTLRDLAGVRPGTGDPPLEALPTSTTHEILAGKRLPRLPRLDFVEAYVAACLRAGRCPADEVDTEVERWRRGWRALAGTDANGAKTSSNGASSNGTGPAAVRFEPAEPVGDVLQQGRDAPARESAPWRSRLPRRQALTALTFLVAGAVGGGVAQRYLFDSPAAPAGPNTMVQDLVYNGTFTNQISPWWGKGVWPRLENGRAAVDVRGNTQEPWDDMVGQSGIYIKKDRHYTLSFDISAELPASSVRRVRVVVQIEERPHTNVFEEWIPLVPPGSSPQQPFAYQPQAFRFTSFLTATNGQVVFQFGGPGPGYTAYIDNVSLVEHPQ